MQRTTRSTLLCILSIISLDPLVVFVFQNATLHFITIRK